MATDTLVSERERLYRVSAGKPDIVHVPEMSFVMIDGHGDPNTSQDYRDAIEALYALSYTLKFALMKEQGLHVSGGSSGGSVVGRGYGRVRPRAQGRLELDHDDRSA